MNETTIPDISEGEWAALKALSQAQHNTVFDGENSGTATTDTPGLGHTAVAYNYDPATKQATFRIKESPNAVPNEVIWFALGATIAHVSGAPARSY